MAGATAVSATITWLLLGPAFGSGGPVGAWDIVVFELLGWWWVFYFASTLERTKLYTLRRFLDGASRQRSLSHPGPASVSMPHLDAEEVTVMQEKARSSRDVEGILIAVVVLVLTLVLLHPPSSHASDLERYEATIRPALFTLAVVVIVAWIISMDVFETISNSFTGEVARRRDLRRYFYRELAPWGLHGRALRLSGAVSYGYLGMATMGVFVLMAFSYFEPPLGGYGAALFCYLAYPYFFGYHGVVRTQPAGPTGAPDPGGPLPGELPGGELVDIDDRHRWPSLAVGLVLVVGTVVAQTWH